ncbi:D-apionate lactonase [Pararhizobium antarcticum]|uniref:Uncharacterized protein n=1 Tax=Pararhizobium antarcticum TaxID=1798805 RepID=A0A657LRD1_9HYPH|nr:hypothetical protein [Pararhizobium antarcticum]OJF94401.1 hypothetical protein AX760_20370 [Pararhizobium antarcticum]OJF95806.1 hypothetical protein AX761_16845 [Rhizobium sp. 58]
MSDAALAFRLYGTTRVEPSPRLLKAGRLSVELAGGNLRNIRYDGVELVRAISYLVRDRDWGTYDPVLSDLAVHEDGEGFKVRYSALCVGPNDAVLQIVATLTAGVDGTLRFEVEAGTQTGFETNRCGFCILHPIVGLAGTPVTVEHVDGSTEQTALPDLIEPWQPFKDMRAMTHTALPGVSVECRMDGDTFEMEDQRNWSDASYKTYVRPLALPWPYRIEPGEPVRQSITLMVTDTRTIAVPMAGPAPLEMIDSVIRIVPGESAVIMPAIGLIIAPEEAEASLALMVSGRAPSVQDLVFHFDPAAGHEPSSFTHFAAIAAGHKGRTVLEVALACKAPLDKELPALADGMAKAGFAPDAIMVSPSVDRQSTPPGSAWPPCPALPDVYAAAASAFPGVRLGGGMLSFFTELNRKRVPADNLAFISHCTNPIVHAADDISVMQTLEALPFITRSIRAIYGKKSYRLGPSTIAMRQNPYGSRTMENAQDDRMPMADRDPRHNALFGAAFALGYAIRVLDAGLECLTLSALTGRFGLISGVGEPVAAGGDRPLTHVVRMLAQAAGQGFRACSSSSPERALAVLIEEGTKTKLLVVNITAQTQTVDLSALGKLSQASLTMLDDSTMQPERGVENPSGGGLLPLRPFAIARIDF